MDAGGCPSRSTGTRSRGWSGSRSVDAEPAQEAEVGGAAAERDVLAVVELEAVALERERRAAEPRARLVERHLGAARRRTRSRRRARRARRRRRRRCASSRPHPARLRASTSPFSQRPEREPAAEDERRLGRDPLEQPAVLARHREDARGAAAVEQRHERRARASSRPSPRSRLERDHELDRPLEPAAGRLAAEPLEVLARQVDAPVRRVLADVAEDVPDLERDPEARRRAARPARGRSSRRRRARGGRSSPRRSGSSARARRTSRTRVPRTSISAPSTSSPNASSGIGKRASRVGERDEDGVVAVVDVARARSRIALELGELLLRRAASPSATSSIRRASA